MTATLPALPTPSWSPATTTTQPLSAVLISLLDAPGSLDEGAGWVAQFKDTLAEARAALPALKADASRPAGEQGVKAVISKRFVLYPQPTRTEAEWSIWWADYFVTLADLPLPALEAGMRRWMATESAEFLPKPGPLRILAQTTPSRTISRYQRAARAVEMADAAFTPPPDPAIRAQVGELLRDLSGRLGAPASGSVAGRP